MPKKQANPIDAQVGNRVRIRRMLIGMSQEKLEQLRVLESGFAIAVGFTDDSTIGVDTPEDALKLEALLN